MKSTNFTRTGAVCSLLASLVLSQVNAANDWPQWRGPNRDGRSNEQGLLKSWPESGPEQVWIFKQAGKGYAGPAIVGGKLYTMGTRGNQSILLCLDAETGTEIWAKEIGGVLGNSWGDGPRGTPTVDGDAVYAMNGEGNLVCAATKDGQIRWQTTMGKLGGSTPNWGYTESVLIDGDKVIVTPGGDQGTVAALNKVTGKLIWQSKGIQDKAHYSSVVKAEINRTSQYVQRTEKSIFGIEAATGKVLWKTDFPGRTAVIPTPIVLGNRVYVTAGYGAGCKAIEIQPNNEVKELYSNREMKNHHGGVIRVGGHVFGYSDGVGWLCQNLSDGSEAWSERKAFGKGALTYVDGMLICLDERNGDVMLMEASTSSFQPRGKFTLEPQSEIRASRGKVWTHPVVVNGKLYLRDQNLIYCYNIK